MRFFKSPVLAALALSALVSPAGAGDTVARRLLTLDDFGAVRQPGPPRVSPDGSRVSYEFDGRLYLVAGDGAPPHPIATDLNSASGSRWSADGKSIYFLSERDAGSQVYRLPIDAPGEAVQVTHFDRGVASLNLSPDETRIVLAISDDELRDPPESPEPIVVTRRHFKRDAGNGYITDGSLNHLYVYDIRTQEIRQVTSGPYDDGEAAWAPDGRHVVFASNRQADPDSDYRTDLFVVDVAGGSEPKLRRLTDGAHTKSSPAWSPDGQQIAYLSAEDGVYAINRIALIPAAGGKPRFLTADFDRSVSSISYSADGEWIYFDYPDSGTVGLARVNVGNGRIESLVEGERVVSAFDVGASGDLALVMQDGVAAGDVYRLRDGSPLKLTDLNREFLDGVELGHKTKVSVPSSDNTTVDTFITTPPGYDGRRPYPAVLLIHGGPVSQFSWGFNFRAQFLASRGYVVIVPNPRGSYGRGQEFIRAIYRTWGLPDYDDVMASVDYAVAKGIADPSRLVVTGYSYGGYMTNVIITQTDRFKAAVSGAGHSLIEANVGHDIYGQWYYWELGAPWQHRERYDLLSPVLRAGNVTTPTLFYGGRIDWNVPVLNSELFYQALRARGVDSELVVYPDMYHGGWSEDFEKDSLKRTVEWFDRYLGGN